MKNNDKTTVSYGGAQTWFFNMDEKKWYSLLEQDYTLRKKGCGLISGSDVMLYLSLKKQKYMTPGTALVVENTSGNLNYDTYMDYLYYMSDRYFTVLPMVGAIGTNISLGINHYCADNKLGLNAKWCTSKKKMLSRIKKMLENDIPVTFSIGPYKEGYGINFYDWEPKTNDIYSFVIKNKPDKVAAHYVTITGMMIDKVKNQTILEISSWGKKFYINYEEYSTFVDKYSNYVFSNIVYIER